MKIKHEVLFLSLLTLIVPGMAQKVNQKKAAKELMEISRQWSKAAQSGDVDQIVSYWSDDAVLMTPDNGKLTGKEQLTGMVSGAMQIPGFEISWEPKEAHVSESGEMGFVLAHKSVKVPDESGNFNTFYFIEVGIWEKQKVMEAEKYHRHL
ncbi:MAG: nuclear transport factor 2 family protein [Saprospiraceae bacterium]